MPRHIVRYCFSAQGRLSRADYWLKFKLPIALFCLASIALMWTIYSFYTDLINDPPDYYPMMQVFIELSIRTGVILAYLIYAMILIVLLCVYIRRFHDRDKSGWWLLIGLIPIVGPLWIFIELSFLKGTDGDNRFGPGPPIKRRQ